jgi:hypothetical protein
MKIVDAYWEKRNLGVETKEIIIEENDSIEEIGSKLSSIVAEYIVLKVPVGRVDINQFLSDNEYVFIEGSINMVLDVNNAIISPLQERVNSSISYRELVEENEFENVFNEIRKGLFNTDRIFLDKFFTKEQAANRYVNWIKDELKKGSQLYEIFYKEKAIGFFTFKQINSDTYFPFLGGIYSDINIVGAGFSITQKPIEEVLKRNGKYISTYISTNNSTIHKSCIQQGFFPNEMKYIFIKHNNYE